MKQINRKVILIIILVIVFIIIILLSNFSLIKLKKSSMYKSTIDKNNIFANKEEKAIFSSSIVGYLTIESIGVKDYIVKSGVEDEILKTNIGHFSNTAIFNGNVCLAAHNYSIKTSNLFRDINKLDSNDVIIYETLFGKRKYEVYQIDEIKSTDFSVLENTDENIITLITCIGNNKDIRLCVKAKEIKEE